MNVYIQIEQSGSTGSTMEIRFPTFKNNSLWYGDGDIVFTTITSPDFKYETRYTSDEVNTVTLQLFMYEIDSNQLIKTINIVGESVDETPVLSCSTTSVLIGSDEITEELESASITVNYEYLIDDIVLTHNDDGSFYISGDDGLTYYRDLLPIQAISAVTSTTFNLKIKRVYTDNWGILEQDITFSNAGNSFTITTLSEFKQDNLNGQDCILKSDGEYSIVGRNTSNPNINSADHSIIFGDNNIIRGGINHAVFGKDNYIFNKTENCLVSGENNFIQTNTKNSALIGGSGNTINSSLENTVIIGGTGVTATSGDTIYLNGDLVINGVYFNSGGSCIEQDLQSVLDSGNTSSIDIHISDGNSEALISKGIVKVKNFTTSDYSTLSTVGLQIKYNNFISEIKGDYFSQFSFSTLYNTKLYFNTDNNTANRTIYLPDADGTIALLDDTISPYWSGGTGLESVVQINTLHPNTNSGDYSLVGGNNNINSGDSSIVVGSSNINSNDIYTTQYSAVFGSGNYNEHRNCIIAGYENKNKGIGCAIFGWQNTNIDDYPHYSIIAGKKNENIGIYSMVAGKNNKNSGDTSFIFGSLHENNGNNSVILGGSNITCNQDNFVYVPSLNINTNPTTSTDTTPTFLVRNESNGNVEKITNTSWISPSLVNEWDDYGGGYSTPGYMKTADGTVIIRGTYKQPGTSSTVNNYETIFTLPTGYQPQGIQMYVQNSNFGAVLIEIKNNGVVRWVGGNQTSVSFCSLDITFHV